MTKGQITMTDYKLISTELTPEMIESATEAFHLSSSISLIVRAALAVAPAVQGEPVGWQLRTPEGRVILNKEFPAWADGGDGYKITPLYTAPQPAEQKPCPEDIREGAPYDDPAFESLCREYGIWGTAAAAQCAVFWEAGKRAAEQKPAPDVADYEQVLDDHRRLTRELDVLLNGEEGAAQQASLADMVAQLRTVVRNTGKPVLAAPDMPGLTEALRQYQHNDGSGLVFGYDRLLVDQYVAGLVEALARCRHQASYSIGDNEALSRQLAKVRNIVNEALAAHRKGGEA